MDVSAIRSNFPALNREQDQQVFFDNAGGSQTLGTVIDSIRDYLINSNVQLGATYHVGKQASSSYEVAYQAVAKYINASRDEIVLGSSTTQLFRNLSTTLNFEPGDELILSILDHEANISPWVALAERQGLHIKWWKPASKDEPKLLATDLEGLLSSKTRLVTCTHVSNILGTIHDLKAISAITRRLAPHALLCADAVAYAPHRQIDVQELGVDFYAFSWYKVYGPHIAVLYAKRNSLKQMQSLGHFFNPHQTLEHKLGLAGGSYELMAAIPAVTAYLESVGWDRILALEETLQVVLLGYLNGRKDIIIHGHNSPDSKVRVPTVAFTVKGWNPQELVETVEKDSPFAFRWGAFYSNRLVNELLGLDNSGVVRVSLVHYNTVDEVNAFVVALDRALSLKDDFRRT